MRLAEPLTIGEDFALYARHLPSLLFFLGSGGGSALHAPTFTIDEEILKTAPALLAAAAFAFLEQGRSAHDPDQDTGRSIPRKSNKMIYAVAGGLAVVLLVFFTLVIISGGQGGDRRSMAKTLSYLKNTEGLVDDPGPGRP